MEWNEFRQMFSAELNEQQTEAVKAVNGPVLLLAVPGSGKTTVLVTRLGYMICCCGISPSSILTLTYTRAATGDMARRFADLFGQEMADKLEFRTINSVCDSVIRFYGQMIGKPPFALESDEKLISRMLTEIYRKTGQDYPTENEIQNLKAMITYCKNMRLSSLEIEELGNANEIRLLEIFEEYQKTMRLNRKMDYDDQMVYAYNILQRSRETLEHFQKRYSYICVDEAQDTSKIQHEIIALLAADNENLFMVGDEDQSIYGFRAAWPEALLKFDKVHKGAKVLLMEKNFRSSGKIIKAADRLIQNNTLRHQKHMTGCREEGEEIRKVALKSARAQYSYLLKVADGVRESSGTQRTAVLYRNNESVLPLVHMMEKEGIPYRMQNRDLMFFSHRTVSDIRNIMLFASDSSNTELFMQIYYKIGLYINRQEAQKACRESARLNIPVLSALEKKCGLSGYRALRVRTAAEILNTILEVSSLKALGKITKDLEYGDYLERSGFSDDKVRILRFIASNNMSVPQFLSRLDYLQNCIRTRKDDPSCRFILSTIHSSKGLEYERVFLLDCVDGIFPRSQDESETLEEERRMFYVAVTRAKDMLTVFSLPQESLFISELTEGDVAQNPFAVRSEKNDRSYKFFLDQLGAGIPVSHRKFGTGVVVDMDEESVIISFDEGSERTFDLKLLFEKNLLYV